jgi:hypothetical protein
MLRRSQLDASDSEQTVIIRAIIIGRPGRQRQLRPPHPRPHSPADDRGSRR